ncbi:ankyrin repeat-containing protein BDA1-like [Olea europaea var. sylvestris]|uniref:ankyrin repeat-containing protein BDA1-like n=1 Tax=Olea europaea var. sylvestris TaxID=158386 RepID=UPI000C1D8286|nr:ankyrin repeat-containing protein BDA1-like [Olea europaea var. sylvestris]
MPFAETPLHIAASKARTSLALEISRLKPTLGRKLNLDGRTSLDLSLRNRHITTVKRLVRHNPDLVCVPGREGITPLHYAAESDETAVRIAVRNKNLKEVHRSDDIAVIRFRDEQGNTVLHLLVALTH